MTNGPDRLEPTPEPPFGALFHRAPTPACILDARCKITRVNAAMVRITGYGGAELQARDLGDVCISPKSVGLTGHIQQARVGAPKTVDLLLRHKSGRLVPVRLMLVPLPARGRNHPIVVVMQERSEAEELRSEVAHMREIVRDAERINQSGTWYRSGRTGEFWWSAGLVRVFQMPRGTAMELESLLKFVHAEDVNRVQAAVAAVTGVGAASVTFRFSRGDGAKRLAHMRLEWVPTTHAGPRTIGVVQDVTDLYPAEPIPPVAHPQAGDDLRGASPAEMQFQSVVEYSADGIIVMDDQFAVQLWNRAAERLFGYAAEEVLGHVPQFLVASASHGKVRDFVARHVSCGQHGVLGRPLELEGIRKDGTSFPMEVSLATWTVAGVPQFAVVVRDITERKCKEEFTRKSDRLTGVSQIAAGLAHEIRNPLTTVKGFTQLLMSHPDHDYDRYFDLIQSELTRMELLLNDLAILAQPKMGSFQNASLDGILNDLLPPLCHSASITNVDIRTDIPSRLPQVCCDVAQLKLAFVNVIRNAIESMPCGGSVHVRLWRDANHVVVGVADEGTGIPKERLKTLGEPFYTTKEKGTGLGLTVSFKIIEAHDGRIDLDSEVHKGTTVRIYLPAVK